MAKPRQKLFSISFKGGIKNTVYAKALNRSKGNNKT